MTPRQFWRVVPILVSFVALAASHASAQPNEKSMYVSVVDQNGAPVEGLSNADFIIREDNVAREVLRVVPATQPMDIALLVDTSQQARNDISQMRQALPTFVDLMTKPNDAGRKNQIAIVAFGERPTIFTEYTSDPAPLKKGIDRIWAMQGAGAYFVDAIGEVVQGFKKREAARPVIVAVVVEGQELSYRQYDQVLPQLKDADAPLYALMLGAPRDGTSDEARSRSIVLDRGTAETGGVREQLLTSMALGAKLKQLADQLTHQYVVTYARPQSLIPPEHITVTAAKPALIARGTPVKDSKPDQRKP
ncbi:MAG TPA: VWA domain-containing protein [Vicinamibacterales bacterium]|nr:VWA domain-containing protein [Vicinamibacterales bacterium]